jgi:hypothetical protein
MKWPWSSRGTKVWPISGVLPTDPERDHDDVRLYARRVTLHLHDQGIAALDLAAKQSSYEWCHALTELGRSYDQAAASWLTICDRFGMLPEPFEPSPDASRAP